MTILFGLLSIIGAYLMGSISSAILVCRAMGLPDPRSDGSGNPGTTNVLRLGGKKAAALTLLGDMLKGVIPVALAKMAGMPEWVVALSALAAFLGHLYPVFFSFQGGKGVATGLGALLGLHLPAGLLAIGIWLASALVFRISSLSALITFAAAPLLLLVSGLSFAAMVFVLLAVLLFYQHRENIRRLLAGEEPKLGKK